RRGDARRLHAGMAAGGALRPLARRRPDVDPDADALARDRPAPLARRREEAGAGPRERERARRHQPRPREPLGVLGARAPRAPGADRSLSRATTGDRAGLLRRADARRDRRADQAAARHREITDPARHGEAARRASAPRGRLVDVSERDELLEEL